MFIKEKRELLITELFTNKVEVRNILLNIPIAVICYIDFSPIITKDIYKAIIKAGNTISSADKVLTIIL